MQRKRVQGPPGYYLLSIKTTRCNDRWGLEGYCSLIRYFIATNTYQESQTGIINLDEDPPEIIEKMIQFLYTLRYDDNRGSVSDAEAVQNPDSNRQVTKPENPPPQIPETAEGPLLTNAKLFALGDLYDISGLRYYAKCRYEETVKNRWNNEFFTQSIELVYDRCSEESLKEVMVQAAYNNIKILLERGEFLQLLKTCAEFSYGVLRSLLDKGAWMLYECNCSSNPKRIQYRVTCSYCGRNLANEYKTM